MYVIIDETGNCLESQNGEIITFETETECIDFIKDYSAEDDHGLLSHYTDDI